MLRIIKDRIWQIIKKKDVSLVLFYDDSGEILWHQGREIFGNSVKTGTGFSNSFILESLSKREKLLKEGALVNLMGDSISDSAELLFIKCLIIIPILDKYFLYLDSGSKSNFSKDDLLSFEILGVLLGDMIEMIRLKERDLDGISGVSETIKNIRDLVLKYSFEEEPILLIGETGVGKNHIAEIIHRFSGRKGRFVVVPVPSIPESLFENEVFGHIKGAFTSADINRKGLVAEAEGGTLFFDEIAEIPVTFQAKLLQLIDTKKYRVLGDSSERKANFQIVTASNIDLKKAVYEGTFRKDLYFRLNVLPIEILPIRERKEDIVSIVKENERYLKGKKLGPGFWKEVLKHDWPGNIRELIHVVKRAGIELDGPVIGKEIFDIIYQGCFKNIVCKVDNGIDHIWEELKAGNDFWEVVKRPFLKREFNRYEVKSIIKKGLNESGGKYIDLLRIFNIEEKEYKNFMRFLYDNQLN